MKRKGGLDLATSLEGGAGQSEESPDRRPGEARISSRRRGPWLALFADSIAADKDGSGWARRLATVLFIAGVVYFFCGPLAIVYLVTHANNPAASALVKLLPANLWSAFGLATTPPVLMFSGGYVLLNFISRTHDEIRTVEVLRGFGWLAEIDPQSHAKMADHLKTWDRNPKLGPGESLADIERTRRPLKAILQTVLDVVTVMVNGRTERARVDAQVARHKSKHAAGKQIEKAGPP